MFCYKSILASIPVFYRKYPYHAIPLNGAVFCTQHHQRNEYDDPIRCQLIKYLWFYSRRCTPSTFQNASLPYIWQTLRRFRSVVDAAAAVIVSVVVPVSVSPLSFRINIFFVIFISLFILSYIEWEQKNDIIIIIISLSPLMLHIRVCIFYE